MASSPLGRPGFAQVVTLHEKYEIRPGWVGLDGKVVGLLMAEILLTT